MANGDAMRASDADRERVVQGLQEQVGEGRLTLAEFEQRSDQVYTAKTVGELRKLVDDLPMGHLFPQASPFGGAPWMQAFPAPNIPAWQQRGVPPMRPVKASPVVAVVVLLIAASIAGMILFHIVPFMLPLLLVFLLIRRGGGNGPRRYPPYR
jgi:hypothetical protein